MEGEKTWLTHRRQTSLIQAYKNLFPDRSASIPAKTMSRNSLSMYVFFVYNKFSHCLFVNSSLEVTFRIALALLIHAVF
jgi:hypothetical protein